MNHSPATPIVGEGFEIADFDLIPAASCPCGATRRAFVDDDGTMSIHRVEIQLEDRPHRHKTDEIYYILQCGPDATMEINQVRYPIQAGQAIKIRGGIWHCAHRGTQPMNVLVVVATGHGSPEAEMEFPQ